MPSGSLEPDHGSRVHPLGSPPLSLRRPEGLQDDAAPRSPHQLSPVSSGDLSVDGRSNPSHAARLQAAVTPRKFDFAADIVNNDELARAARAEAASASPRCQPSFEPLQHGPELDRQAAVIDRLDAGAHEESGVNQALAALMQRRLAAARSASERTLGALRALAGAELAQARALGLAAGVTLAAETDGPGLRRALAAFQEAPRAAAACHARAADGLDAQAQTLRALVDRLRREAAGVASDAAALKAGVDAARRSMQAAAAVHRAACGRAPGALGRGGVEADPWVTEARLVQGQARLMAAQQAERRFLAKVGAQVESMERERAAVLSTTLAASVRIYGESLACVERAAPRLEALLESANMDADLAAFCDTAAHSVAAGEALAARQAGLLAGVRRELAASPEVLRAGAMEAWDAARGVWVPDRFVLTRAGFLHRLARSPGGDPEVSMVQGPPTPVLAESVALARCTFEQGEAPVFRLVEIAAGSLARSLFLAPRTRARTFRTASVEECMDWAIALREVLAACTR
ncbi:hypothetical protein ACKKBG_A16340 [Auxenochlorella protothecoides x Auxenochlorella symbiontica]